VKSLRRSDPTIAFDLPLTLCWLATMAVGTVMVASASVAFGDSVMVRHTAFLLVGLIGFLLAAALPLKIWEKTYLLSWTVAIALCGIVLIPGVGVEVNGSQRWIGLGAVSIQVAELAKGLMIVFLAGYLAKQGECIEEGRTLAKVAVMFAVPALLILLQPDFGTVVVLAVVLAAVLFVAGARLRHYLMAVLAGAGGLMALAVTQPYRIERLASFTDPWSSAFGSGYQLTQALIAFGRGEVTGLGLGEGIQKLYYLPEAHNDFIFAVIAEELGIIGSIGVLLLLAFLAIRILRVGRTALERGRRFDGFLCYGIGLLIAIQTLVNVGVNTGMLPTKGLTLPFVSFGGNSLVVCCVLMGLVLRVTLERDRIRG
jgi:cell division protein FtsW|tara:strand:+ start:1088 stop:2197 length:1110 start_codon:yes stop_codon:yes gene_type:complete